MRDERARILDLLREGKITVEEAEQLLDALGTGGRGREAEGEPWPAGGGRPRSLCVRITDTYTGKVKVNIHLPSAAWGLLEKLSRTKLGRRIGGLALDEIQRAARSGTTSHLVDVTDDDRGERVEVFFE